MRILLLCMGFLMGGGMVSAQKVVSIHSSFKISEDSIYKIIDSAPNFGMFHENYFATGIPVQGAINSATADAKIQVSIRQRLFRSYLPAKTILFMTYTQKSFWDIYANSSPFKDNNYNPGLSLCKPLFFNHEFRGNLVVSLEHESNGRDSIYSRSWNYYLAVSYLYILNRNLSAQVKLWKGSLDEVNNPDLMKYKGYGLLALNYFSTDQRLGLSFIVSPTHGFSAANTTLEVDFKPTSNTNQYFFFQWYNGYAEDLLNFRDHSSMLRFGVCIKSPFGIFF